MLYNIPIESLEERYSAQWNTWFPREFKRHGVDWILMYGHTLSDKIREGAFLDVISTNYFKADQLKLIIMYFNQNKIKDGDIFFFHDLWFPGIEMLAYVRDALGIDFKIYGCLHAGTWDEYDFLYRMGMRDWGKHVENGWFKFIDGIFVATDFHKNLITYKNLVEERKIHVTGFPIFPEDLPLQRRSQKERENIVVFPHRLDPEKNPQLFDELKSRIEGVNDWNFIKTKETCFNKSQYYMMLNKSKIALSFSDQETWGIAMQEAVFCGCIPLVPDDLSYRELYPEDFRFSAFGDCVNQLRWLIENPVIWEQALDLREELHIELASKGQDAIPKMLEIMGF